MMFKPKLLQLNSDSMINGQTNKKPNKQPCPVLSVRYSTQKFKGQKIQLRGDLDNQSKPRARSFLRNHDVSLVIYLQFNKF